MRRADPEVPAPATELQLLAEIPWRPPGRSGTTAPPPGDLGQV